MYIENGMVTMTLKEFNKMQKGEKLVTRAKFLKKYNKEQSKWDCGKVYGNDVTVHWNGIYCTCGDGATAYNHIIAGIDGADSELDPED